jgi:hypothetical protein
MYICKHPASSLAVNGTIKSSVTVYGSENVDNLRTGFVLVGTDSIFDCPFSATRLPSTKVFSTLKLVGLALQ